MSENTNQQMLNSFQLGYSPYGNGSNSQSAIVALGESWAYYKEFVYCYRPRKQFLFL